MEGIMSTLTKYTRNAKAILLAGTLSLLTISAFAQQEVDPEHFDQPIVAQKAAAPKPHKQVATAHKTKAAQKSNRQEAASKKTPEQPKVVTIASR
jgi:hypothetical protein